MRPETLVMFELHQNKVIGKAAEVDAKGCCPAFQPVHRHEKQAAQMQVEFLLHCQPAMGPEVPVAAIEGHHQEMVERPVEDVLAHVAPMRRRFRHLDLRPLQRAAHLRD